MAVKLIDLQLIYGVAGAREKFEDLASKLVKGEQPDADKVRIEQGDGGIDVYVGALSDPDGIDVYQCKFYPMGLEDAQKEQIRKSYRNCRDSKKFKTKSWVICLPVDLTIDEKKWFEDWRTKQASAGIVIGDPWGAMKLESLLYQAKNRGLKESFFKDEYLTQIRDLHHMMTRLLADLATRDSVSESSRRDEQRAIEEAKQEEYISTFVKELQVRRASLTRLPAKKLSEIQQARRAKVAHPSEVIEKAMKQCGYFGLVIHPTDKFDKQRFGSINECWDKLQSHQLERDNYHIPGINHQRRESGHDWVGSSNVLDYYADAWRLSQRGVFAYSTVCFSNAYLVSKLAESAKNGRLIPNLSQRSLDVREAVGLLTLMFAFAAKFAEVLPDDDTFHIDISFLNTESRVLVQARSPLSLRGEYRCSQKNLENRWNCSRKELAADSKKLAVRAAIWFFERFNWSYLSEEVVEQFL